MAAYKDLVGQKITVVTSNPPEPKTGQMWYNSTDGVLRGLSPTSAWRSSAPLLVARDAAGSAGTQTTATIFGGNINPGNTSATDEYNGNGFSSGGALNTARRQTSGCGLQTAALCVGGYTTANAANVEEYNGTSWSEQNDIPGVYRNGSTFGTQTAALYVGGYSAPVPNSTSIQIYDGTNWTTSPATLGTGGNAISSTGTSTAGLVFGGSNRLNLTEEWNGSAMSTGGNLTTSKYDRGSANQAPSENAMSAGGGIPAQTTVENYDGTSWSTLPSLAVATNSLKGAGTATSAMMMGGGPGAGPVFNTSTEFDESTNTITAGAWASGNNLNTGRNAGAGFGIQTAAVMTTGNEPGETNKTEHYDGTSWTNATNYPISKRFTAASGTLTSGLVAGGSPAVATVNKYDGTNWTAANSLPTSTDGGVMFGTQTASVYSVGRNPSATTNTYEFDGTNWTAGGAAGTARYFLASSGTLTAGLMFGGQAPGPSIKSETEEYDGTSWSESGDLGTARYGVGGSSAGTQTDTIAFAGNNPAVVLTEGYDGTSWSTRPNMATARRFISGAGTATLGIGFGGNPPNNSTEEFTGETETPNVTDFSTE